MNQLTNILLITCVLLATVPATAKEIPRNQGTSWPTLHGDLARSGYYPRFPRGSLKLVWRKELYRELTGTRCEVILSGERAFMGTYAGRVYAWDAASGQQSWVRQLGGAVVHSPALDDGVLYVGSMDRRLYALDSASGEIRWSFEAQEGIAVSPAVHDGRVLFGDRAGNFYAVRRGDGKSDWSLTTGGPILTTASISDDGRQVLFAAEDMRVRCLDIRNGQVMWQSEKLSGLSVRDHFPVIVGGLAIVTTNPVKGFHETLNDHQSFLLRRAGVASGQGEYRYVAGDENDVAREQDAIVDYLRTHREEQTFYAFRLSDGQQPWIAPIFYTAGLHNPPTPPCYNPHTNDTFVLVRSAYTVWDGGGEVRPLTGVGQLDLQTGRVKLLVHGYSPRQADRPAGRKDMPFATFNTIGDETQTLSCSDTRLFSNHQGFLGTLDFDTRLCTRLLGQRDTYGGFYGPGLFGWREQGGVEKARQAGQPFGIVNQWHGPAQAIASVAGNRVYYSTGSQVLCFEGNGE